MTTPVPPVVAYEPSLGRDARQGSWAELSRGTFRTAIEKVHAAEWEAAARLVEVSVLEAEELRDVYDRWPTATLQWVRDHGATEVAVEEAVRRLGDLIGEPAMAGIAAEWPEYIAAAAAAARLCRDQDPAAAESIEAARRVWQGIHDRAVDRVAGMIDIAVRLVGESALGALWDHLMGDWYDVHERRYALTNQPWEQSAHQLMVAIVDGFHAHLAGTGRQGDIELIEEPHRTGFRFAPCGSGGRSLDPAITDGQPRSGAPFGFAVTTQPHDWAWNTVGICSYCVHCCQLNEVMPIDRLGHPTRVIDPPTWGPEATTTSCTWWVYHDPADVPDSVYRRVGRDPALRPSPSRETAHG
ncbi:hypothetical protein [Mycobacterium sp. ACS4331]|uniref:hypothetical protein n=1 Tax=Mycobacterium sp. ACS4331 TaxID=1834121 RepID=UPI0007FF1E20|nr:hypothetical protein [Mycobacterium sp. ACS4331]OBF19779.1 hypothetical protein A5727_10020 [Mycobacterium sp. ACS4331]